MNTIKQFFRGIVVIFIVVALTSLFGAKVHGTLAAHHIYTQWWFWAIVVFAALTAYGWIKKGSPSSNSHKKGRDYRREYSDCNKAWQLIHKNGWTADDFAEAQQLLNDGHLRWTNNGDYIKELNKKIAQESLKVK